MTSRNPPAIPGRHGQFLAEQLPAWLKHATADDIQRWRKSLGAEHLSANGQAEWFTKSRSPAQDKLLAVQQRSRRSNQALAVALKDFKGVLAFCEPLFREHLRVLDIDLDNSELVRIHREEVLAGALVKTIPSRQGLLQAALQNFADASEFEWGSALTPKNALRIVPVAAQAHTVPAFQYSYDSTLDVAPAKFAALCHELDLGGRYQAHLHDIFEHEHTREQVRTLSIRAMQDQLRVARQVALMKGEISPPAAQMLESLLNGEPAPLLHGKPIICQSLSMLGVQLFSVVVFSAELSESAVQEPIVVYLPGAPLHPLKEYASSAEFVAELRLSLPDPAYQTLFQGYVSQAEHATFFPRLSNQLYHQVETVDGLWVREVNPYAVLMINSAAIGEELFGYLQDRQVQRIKANALEMAVPSAAADLAVHRARLAYWESIGLNVLNAVALFVPAVGAFMAWVNGALLVNEIIEGTHAWGDNEREQALAHLQSVMLNLALVAVGGAGHGAPAVVASEQMDGLLRVKLPSGEERLWQPQLQPYAREVELSGIAPDRRGVYRLGDKHYVEIEGQVVEVFQGPADSWSIRHPDDPHAYQPALRHNGEGSWQLVGEQPLHWTHAQLLRRLGTVTRDLPEEVLEQAQQISGISDDVLRRMHLNHAPLPPLLGETLRRLRSSRRVERLIDSLRQGVAQGAELGLGAPLGVELPRWPQRIIEVYNETAGSAPIRYGAERWPMGEVIRISVADLYANKLAEVVLENLTEAERYDLLGSSVEADKRVEVLRALIAMRAVERRADLLKIFYEQGRAPRSTEQQRLLNDFPGLSDAAAEEIVFAAGRVEAAQLAAAGGRVPLRLAEEARIYQRQFSLNRALEGLLEAHLADLDSDRLAVGLLARLPGWSNEVRLELREHTTSGRLLAAVGNPRGELKVLVRQGNRYAVYDAQGHELSRGEAVMTSLLKALPDSERDALGFEVYAPQSLRTALYEFAVTHRAEVATVLGQQPQQPWFRSPMRLADGRVGYPLSGRGQGSPIPHRLKALYPELSDDELRETLDQLLTRFPDVGTALNLLEVELDTLKDKLAQWMGMADDNLPIWRRRFVLADQLRQAWRRKGGAAGTELRIDDAQILTLARLDVTFDYIESLTLDLGPIQGLPEGLLSSFTQLTRLSLENSALQVIPAEVATLTRLRALNLNHNALHSNDTMFEALRPLRQLQTLLLFNNRLLSIPEAALQTLATLPALMQLDLRLNALNFNRHSLEVLARMPLRALLLSGNRQVLDDASAQVFSQLSMLEYLYLSDNPLGQAPELGTLQLLTHVDMNNCALQRWPEGLTTLMSEECYALRNVELEDNQIVQLPQLLDTPFGRDLQAGNDDQPRRLALSYNPLDADSEVQLRNTGSTFVAPQLELPAPVWPLTTADERALWQDLFTGQNTALSNMLGRLTLSQDYLKDAVDVQRRVWDMLRLAAEHTELRQELESIAEQFPATCGDAGADAFSALEIAVLVFRRSLQASSQQTRSSGVLQLYKQLFRRHEVQRLADTLSLRRTLRRNALLEGAAPAPALAPQDDISDALLIRDPVDDIEIRLTLRQALASTLDYPEAVREMLYQATANVTAATVAAIANAVRVGDSVERRLAWMVRENSWQRFLKQRYQQHFDDILHFWQAAMGYLEYCNSVDDPAPAALDARLVTWFQTTLGLQPVAEDGSLLKLQIDESKHLQAVNATLKARENADATLIAELTRVEQLQ